MIGVLNIPAMFEVIVNKVDKAIYKNYFFNVHFDYGRYNEVTRTLIAKAGGVTTPYKRFPLIWMVYPFTVVESIAGIGAKIEGLNIVLACETVQESTTPERMQTSFIKQLYPMFAEFKNQIDRSRFFSDIDFDNVFKRIDQPYWDGKDGEQKANAFEDFIDAIELRDISLTVNEETCERFQLIGGHVIT